MEMISGKMGRGRGVEANPFQKKKDVRRGFCDENGIHVVSIGICKVGIYDIVIFEWFLNPFSLQLYINQQKNQMSTQAVQSSPPMPKPEETATASKKVRYENVWRALFVVVLALAVLLFQKVYVFQTHPQFETIKEGSMNEILIYGLPFAVVFSIFDWLIHYYLDDVCAKHYITDKRYVEPQAKKKRCYTLVKWGYSCIYYLVSSLWAYWILRETTFMPTWLGGKGNPYSQYQNVPKIVDVTFEMKVFYILQFGKHFSRFFGHVFIRPEGNFFEYTLHHGLSTFLIVFSYLTNQWLIGIFVLLVHDYSDFGLTIGRGYNEYKHSNKILLDLFYVHGFIAWFGCRIFLFVAVCIVPSVYTLLHISEKFTEFEMNVLFLPYSFMCFMMVGLEIMHIYWTYYIIESFVAVKISAKLARHSYD